MVTKKHGVFIETPIEERQAEPGVISTALAVSLLGLVWLLFFQT